VRDLPCPTSANTYTVKEVKDCVSADWVVVSSNQVSACCTLPLEETKAGSCGAYRKTTGSVVLKRLLVAETCSYGPYLVFSASCTCKDPASGQSDPTPSCSTTQTTNLCATRAFTFPKDASGLCTIRSGGAFTFNGSCKPATYKWTNAAAEADELLASKGGLPVVDVSTCSSAGLTGSCVKAEGAKWRLFRGCNCKKQGGITCN
jgi:hypothetical protein